MPGCLGLMGVGSVASDPLDVLAMSLSPALYLDSRFPADQTYVSNVLSQWNDRSGNGRHATQATSTRRWAAETISGITVFRGVNDLGVNSTWMTGSFPDSLTAYTAFVVMANSSTKLDFAGILSLTPAGSVNDTDGGRLTINNTNVAGEANVFFNGGAASITTTHGTANTLELLTMYNDGGSPTSTVSIQRDQQAAVTTTLGQFTSTSAQYTLGTRVQSGPSATYSNIGAFAMYLVYPVKLSAGNITSLQAAIRTAFGTP